MLKLLLGRSGSGKTRAMLETMAASAGKRPQILIVPEQHSHDMERALCAIGGNSVSLGAEVLSFTRLASRLRESGMMVIGMGEEKTPRSFRAACSIFTALELLLDEDAEPAAPAKKAAKRPEPGQESAGGGIVDKSVIESDAVNIVTENENKGKVTGLGELGSRLQNKYPDFDVRNYGYSLLSKFLAEMHSLELVKDGHTVGVRLKNSQDDADEAEAYILQLVREAGAKGVSLSELSNALHARYGQFSVRDYGYSQFSKFVQSVPQVELGRTARTKDRAFYRPEE